MYTYTKIYKIWITIHKMPLDLILTTLVTLITGLLSFFSYSSLRSFYVDKYNLGYPSHKAYLSRWNSDKKFLHDGRDMFNPYGWDSVGKPGQFPLEYPHQILVFPCHWSYIHPRMPIRATGPISAF